MRLARPGPLRSGRLSGVPVLGKFAVTAANGGVCPAVSTCSGTGGVEINSEKSGIKFLFFVSDVSLTERGFPESTRLQAL